MLSHDLARALLARRNNDVRITVMVDGEYFSDTGLADDAAEPARIASEDVVVYAPINDQIVILAGSVYTGPHRGDAVEQWLTHHLSIRQPGLGWIAHQTVRELLADYCRRADEGTLLDER